MQVEYDSGGSHVWEPFHFDLLGSTTVEPKEEDRRKAVWEKWVNASVQARAVRDQVEEAQSANSTDMTSLYRQLRAALLQVGAVLGELFPAVESRITHKESPPRSQPMPRQTSWEVPVRFRESTLAAQAAGDIGAMLALGMEPIDILEVMYRSELAEQTSEPMEDPTQQEPVYGSGGTVDSTQTSVYDSDDEYAVATLAD